MTEEAKKGGWVERYLADILKHKFSTTNRTLMCQLFSPGPVEYLARSGYQKLVVQENLYFAR